MAVATKNISSTDTLTAAGAPIRVLLAAGGTGGHVYPAIAIADAIKQKHPETGILFVGTRDRMEWKTVPKSGYDIKSVWISGFHRRLTLQNLLFPVKLVVSLFQSLSILDTFKPDILVACGGFAAGPVGWVAARKSIPIVIQEQNSYPGVTNRLLAKHAAVIFTAFDEARQFFPEEKVRLEGNPVRKQLETMNRESSIQEFGFSNRSPVLLILGGSGGAGAINTLMKQALDELHNRMGLQIIWQCGNRYLDGLQKEIDTEAYPNLRLVSFLENMPAAYGAADLVITRAGASTCSELMMTGQPAIFIPSPNVAGDHQTKNAASMVQANAALLLDEQEPVSALIQQIESLIFDPGKLVRMSAAMKKLARPDAASNIANEIFKLAEQQAS